MADKVLTMSGAAGTTGDSNSCPPCPPCEKRTTLIVTKKQRYPHGRHCVELNTSSANSCRCARWASGRGGESVTEMCRRAGREFKIGSRVLKAKTRG